MMRALCPNEGEDYVRAYGQSITAREMCNAVKPPS